MSKELSLESYAYLSAHLVHFRKADRAEVLERLGIDPDAADAARKRWSSALRDDLETTDMPLAQRMGESFTPVLDRLRQEDPELAAIGPRKTVVHSGVVPAGMLRLTSVDTTQAPAPARVAQPLPFAAGVMVTPQRASPSEKAQIPEGMRRFVSLTGTVSASSPSGGTGLPFDAPRLALDQHACVHAELARAPAARQRILARWGLDERAMSALDAHWSQRIKADPLLRGDWDAAYAAHLDRLSRSPR